MASCRNPERPFVSASHPGTHAGIGMHGTEIGTASMPSSVFGSLAHSARPGFRFLICECCRCTDCKASVLESRDKDSKLVSETQALICQIKIAYVHYYLPHTHGKAPDPTNKREGSRGGMSEVRGSILSSFLPFLHSLFLARHKPSLDDKRVYEKGRASQKPMSLRR